MGRNFAKIAKLLIAVAVVLAIAGVLIVVRARRVQQMQNAPLLAPAPLPVTVTTVVRTRVVQSVHVLGTVIGADEVDVASQVTARVTKVLVREGDRVKAGKLLAQLDPREFQDAVAAAKASLVAALMAWTVQQAIAERYHGLYQSRSISLEHLQKAQQAAAAALGQLDAARAKLDDAQTQLGYCHIVAPMDGLVASRLADPGALATPGQPLFKFVRESWVRVRAELPPEDLERLHVGAPVTLIWKAHRLPATVSRVFPAMSESQLATLEADVARPPAGFVSGATVGVEVAMNSAEGLTVPADALLEGRRGTWVFVVKEGRVQPVVVKVRASSFRRVVVTGNLQAGEQVIEAEPSRLMTLTMGMKVAAIHAPTSAEKDTP